MGGCFNQVGSHRFRTMAAIGNPILILTKTNDKGAAILMGHVLGLMGFNGNCGDACVPRLDSRSLGTNRSCLGNAYSFVPSNIFSSFPTGP